MQLKKWGFLFIGVLGTTMFVSAKMPGFLKSAVQELQGEVPLLNTKAPDMARCQDLWENGVPQVEDAKQQAKLQKEFDKCQKFLQSFELEIPCNILNRNVDRNGEYVFNQAYIYEGGRRPGIPEQRLSPEDRPIIEKMRFYACVPQWKEEKRLVNEEREREEEQLRQAKEEQQRQQELEEQRQIQEKKEKTAAYFAKCPKGITTTSFDCYKLNKKFVNYGFRGNDFTQWSDRNVYMHADYYPSDTQIYETEGDGGYMKVTVSHGLIVEMTVGFPPAEGSPEAIHLTMKKKFPNLKENSRGAIVAKTGGIEFRAYRDGNAYTIDYESSLREEMRQKEELEELKKETQKASELF